MSAAGQEAARAERGESEALARRLAEVAEGKGASDLIALDVRPLVGYTDFMVISTARNERQAKAIHDEVRDRLKSEGRRPAREEGVTEARWILLDYLDAVLHVFTPDERERYRLETLWGEAEKLDLGASPSG